MTKKVIAAVLLSLCVLCGCSQADDSDNAQIPAGSEQEDSGQIAGSSDESQAITSSNAELPPFEPNNDMRESEANRISGGGYIAERGGWFYFANQDDDNKLYKMDTSFENKEKLSDMGNDTAWLDIQFAEGKLFYLQSDKIDAGYEDAESFAWQRTLYSYDLESGVEAKAVDANFSIYRYVVDDEWVYFSSGEAMELYKARHDGSEFQLLIEPYGEPYPRLFSSLQIVGERLYMGDGERIVSSGLDFLSLGKFFDDPDATNSWRVVGPYAFLVYDEYIFYIDIYTGEFCRENISDMFVPVSYRPEDGDGNVTIPDTDRVVLGENILQFTISEDEIYYCTAENEIYRMGLDGTGAEFVTSGYGPAVIGNYVFYFDDDEKMNCLSK